jgi:hypothetical protein
MAMATNGTSFTVPWITSTFKNPSSTNPLSGIMETVPMWALLLGGFFGVQIVAIILNVLRQVVSGGLIFLAFDGQAANHSQSLLLYYFSFFQGIRINLQRFSTFCLSLAQLSRMVMTPSTFSSNAAKR